MTKVAEKTMTQWTPEEKQELTYQYGCEILLERTTLDEMKNPLLPSDAYVVIYRTEDQTFMDLCRGTRTKVFDLYYDKFGPKSVLKIDWGYGRANPKLWGMKTVEKRKRR